MYRKLFKRLIDIFLSLILLSLLLPLTVLVFISIKLDSRGPIFFKQERIGKNLRLFQVFKFRTMTNETRTVGDKPLIGKAVGVTGVGYYLRRYKIDELPQFINVLKGDISLVGPRPSIQEQLVNMTEDEKKRYSIRPGLTGLAQVSGNIHLSWKDRYQKDLEYVRNINFLNDMRILLRTIVVIIKGENHYLNKPLKFENED